MKPSADKAILDFVFPEGLPTLEDLEDRYKDRHLTSDAEVTRVGPSPTGYVHIGTIYVTLLCQWFARQTAGICILRIEDTDRKREVDGAFDLILDAFDHFGIEFDEGPGPDGPHVSRYGPYIQSEREEIYQAVTADLLSRGLAYVCFSTAADLDKMRRSQKAQRVKPGYYGAWATWRNARAEDVLSELHAGSPYVIRMRSNPPQTGATDANDLIVGNRHIAANDLDIVIMKGDRLPTYHLAHVVDDHFMGTTLVIRGSEWLSSLPLHLQMFETLGWQAPRYAHIAPMSKMDGETKRKLSKRKDPEAGVESFRALGYPPEALIEYLLGLASSDFDPWRDAHPDALVTDFTLTFERLQSSNSPIFDRDKLGSVSRNVIARMSASDVYDRLLNWAKRYDVDFAQKLEDQQTYVELILAIERGGDRARKGITMWSDVKDQIAFFFDETFENNLRLSASNLSRLLPNWTRDQIATATQTFMATYLQDDERDAWFAKMKTAALENGFAVRSKDFKRDPDAYRGTIADFTKLFRVLLTGKPHSPDLYSTMQVLGLNRVRTRLDTGQLAGV